MKLFPPDVLKDLVELGIMTLIALWGLTYGWRHLRVQLANGTFPLWRRTLVIIGLLAVSVQALLFALSWARLGRGNILFGQWERWFAPIFFLAVPCVLFAKGATRWWLLSSSILFFVMCFLFTLTA